MYPSTMRRVLWLLDLLSANPNGLTMDEIQNEWLKKSNPIYTGEKVTRGTIGNHEDQIESLFDIKISIDNYYRHKIEDPDTVSRNTIEERLGKNLITFLRIKNSPVLSNRILFLDEAPNTNFQLKIMRAIENNKIIKIGYQFFGKDENNIKIYTIKPYGLIQSNRRWYVYGPDVATINEGSTPICKTFSLDRIVKCEISDEGFDMPTSYSVAKQFENCIGIMNGNNKEAVEILIKVDEERAQYLDSLPIHKSQKFIEYSKGYYTYSLNVIPTKPLYNRLLSLCPNIEVLSPSEVRNKFSKILEDSWIKNSDGRKL